MPRRSTKKDRSAPEKNPFPLKRALLLLSMTVLFLTVHIVTVEAAVLGQAVSIAVFWLYYAATFVVAAVYVIYNRGFVIDSLTKSALSDSYTEEEKEAYLRSINERKQKSAWLLTVLFALLITLLYEIISLFFGDTIFGWFSSLGGIFGT